ncbi:MAG: oxidoreductase [Rhodospirillales bacterium]|jgi:acrylyl-CoA reductase (NADPH)|nr:oxidoreductase [Rhodospirillales bacterium]
MARDDRFTALVVDKTEGAVSSAVREMDCTDLPEGDVRVSVTHSTLNYKDGMIICGIGGLVRDYPHIPGIDFAGTVETSQSPDFKPGDSVILTGWRVGEVRWGGYATRAQVKGKWLIPLPDGLSLSRSMAIGTAGLTAMLALLSLEEHGLTPESEGEVLVTGAAGGVGSVAVAQLSALGYRVAASTGRAEAHDYLKELGAATIVERAELEQVSKAPLGATRWSAAIDNVGGSTLANVLATLHPGASCASVGLAASASLQTTVIPFLLRGVNLLGIDSAFCPTARRTEAWNRLVADLPMDQLDRMTEVASLADLPGLGAKILKGGVRGRTVIDVGAG